MRPDLPLFSDLPRHRDEFNRLFGTDWACRLHVYHHVFRRLRGAFLCRCSCRSLRLDRHHVVCLGCGRRESLIAGTIFQGTRHDLLRWFKAAFYVTTIPGISARRLAKLLNVTYKTGWLWKQKLLFAMSRRVRTPRLRASPRGDAAALRLQDADWADRDDTPRWRRFVRERGGPRPEEPPEAARARAFLRRPVSCHLSDKHLAASLDSFAYQESFEDPIAALRDLADELPRTPVQTYRAIVGRRIVRPWLVLGLSGAGPR